MFNFRMSMPLYLMALYGSIMIAAILIMRLFLKNKLPKFVFPILWTVVLVRLLIPFSLSSPISAPVPNLPFSNYENNTTSNVFHSENLVSGNIAIVEDISLYSYPGTEVSQSEEYSYNYAYLYFNKKNIALLFFVSGMLLTSVLLLCQRKKYFSILKNSLLIEHNETINNVIQSLGLNNILVFTNDYIASPIVSGIFNSRIYLPSGMDFDNTQLVGNIILHECMHVKRRDNLTKMIMLIAICLHWYNPLIWIMSKCLSADIEAACDYSVLGKKNEDERKGYAYSLLSMAVSKNNFSLIYSAFSKTEVENRIKSVLSYKRVNKTLIAISAFIIFGSSIVFATGGQAPFSEHVSSYCASAGCKWAVKAVITRDIYLGKNSEQRAENIIFDVLDYDKSNDPEIIKNKIIDMLAKEFGVEKRSFYIYTSLVLDDEQLKEEYKRHEIVKDKNGFYTYKNEPVRNFADKMLNSMQFNDKGSVDIEVLRDRMGEITNITVLHKGDEEFDIRSKKLLRNHSMSIFNNETSALVESTSEVNGSLN